jgi:TRAP-type C4-dicarboxylate transport system substrate-binding protein
MSSLPRVRVATLAVVLGMTAAGCAESAGSDEQATEGVPAGASMEDYKAAFESVSPITIRAESPTAQGSDTGRDFEAYIAAVEEWSGGKIDIEDTYAGQVAKPGDVDNALQDGRLDFGAVIAAYEPDEFPVASAVAASTRLGDFSLIEGSLSSNAWVSELSFSTDEFVAEFEDKGMQVLFPASFNGSPAIYCPEPHDSLESFSGAQVAAGSSDWAAQVTALGGSPVSLPFTEVFEGLQRGVVDCSMTGVTGAIGQGILEVAPHMVLDPEVGTTANPSVWTFSKDSWESWPLPVRQLLWDRVDALMTGNYVKTLDGYARIAETIKAQGGSITPYDSAARSAVEESNEQKLDELASSDALEDPEAFVERARSIADKWREVPAELGYTNEVELDEFAEYYAAAPTDTDEFVARVYEDVFQPLRPE